MDAQKLIEHIARMQHSGEHTPSDPDDATMTLDSLIGHARALLKPESPKTALLDYRATIAFNSWTVRFRKFQAESDDAVRAMEGEVAKWIDEEIDRAARHEGGDPSETPDARVIVDRVSWNDGEEEIEEECVLEFDHEGSRPIAYECVRLVQKLAAVSTEPSLPYGEVRKTLNDLVDEARKLCGTEPASKEENAQ